MVLVLMMAVVVVVVVDGVVVRGDSYMCWWLRGAGQRWEIWRETGGWEELVL